MKVEKKRALTFQQRGSKNERKNDNSISFEISTRPRAAATGQRPGPQLRPSHMVWEMSFRISVLTQKTRAPKEVPQRSDFLQSLFAPAGLLDFFFVEPKCAFRQRPEFDMYSCIKSCHSKCYVQEHSCKTSAPKGKLWNVRMWDVTSRFVNDGECEPDESRNKVVMNAWLPQASKASLTLLAEYSSDLKD